MKFEVVNRRYTGSKRKLSKWIKENIENECLNCSSFCDIFAGTASVTYELIDLYDQFIINDFLYSNNAIYNAFFSSEIVNQSKIQEFYERYNNIDESCLIDDFVSINYGNKYFSISNAKVIDFIRNDLETNKNKLNTREYNILLASLLFSLDRISNTVGHYDAYIKKKIERDNFKFDLINFDNDKLINKKFRIFQEDANQLAPKIEADITYIDPPYSSRQYSRFYHVLETITKWNKPLLFGEALKPEPENLSEYSKSKAKIAFEKLITDLNTKYIAVSYNNTYESKSKSSKNKMTLEEIETILNAKGETKIFSKSHKAFSAGKTELKNHREYLFITRVGFYND